MDLQPQNGDVRRQTCRHAPCDLSRGAHGNMKEKSRVILSVLPTEDPRLPMSRGTFGFAFKA
jgi:hypothetical protein